VEVERLMQFVNNLKTGILLSGLMALCLGIGYLIGGGPGLIYGFLFGGLGNIIAFFFSDKIAVTAMGGQEITRADSPWLFDTVQRLTERAGLPMPRVYVCPQPAPNAFATGRNPQHSAVAVTRGLLESMRPEEIEAVLAHEVGHIKHRDVLISTVASVLAGIISVSTWMLMWFGGGRRSDNPMGAIGAILALVLAPIAAAIIQMAISRSREFAADNYGGELCGNPMHLANALRRLSSINERVPTDTPAAMHSMYIVQPLSGQSLASLFSTHPPVEDRIEALVAQAQRMR
jgi:heat shock protein HtpX